MYLWACRTILWTKQCRKARESQVLAGLPTVENPKSCFSWSDELHHVIGEHLGVTSVTESFLSSTHLYLWSCLWRALACLSLVSMGAQLQQKIVSLTVFSSKIPCVLSCRATVRGQHHHHRKFHLKKECVWQTFRSGSASMGTARVSHARQCTPRGKTTRIKWVDTLNRDQEEHSAANETPKCSLLHPVDSP